MDKESINYFIYARKSTEAEGRQILSIPGQMEDLALVQKRERLNVVGTFSDAKSAKTPHNRPEYFEMIRRIKKGEASGIIVWKIDRLARNHLEGGELIHLLQTGVLKSIWTIQREYLSRDSALLISLESSMAAQYSVDLAERVHKGLHKKAEMGQPPTLARMGYLNTKLNESGTNSIIVDPQRWHLMRKAFDLMLTGQYSIPKIASILNNEHNFRTRSSKNRTGRPMAISILHRALTDQYYAGYFTYKGKMYKGTYKPMITLEEFDTIQAILKSKNRQKAKRHEFAFTGLMTCGFCGCAITGTRKLKKLKSTGEYRVYTFYHCTKRKGTAACKDKHFTTEQELLEQITNELGKITLHPRWKEYALNSLADIFDDGLVKHENQLKAVREYESNLQKELDTILDMRIANQLTNEQFMQKKAEREALLIRVQERLSRMNSNTINWIEEASKLLDFATEALAIFQSGSPSEQKEICLTYGYNWILKEKKIMFTRFEWFSDLEKIKNNYAVDFDPLEPKTAIKYKETTSFLNSLPLLSSLRDVIRTNNGLTIPSNVKKIKT